MSLKSTLKVLLFLLPELQPIAKPKIAPGKTVTSRCPYQAHFKHTHTHTHTLKPLQTSTQHLCFDYKLQPQSRPADVTVGTDLLHKPCYTNLLPNSNPQGTVLQQMLQSHFQNAAGDRLNNGTAGLVCSV